LHTYAKEIKKNKRLTTALLCVIVLVHNALEEHTMQITQQQLSALQTETSNAALTIAQIDIVEDSVVKIANSYYKILDNNYVLQLENDFESWGN